MASRSKGNRSRQRLDYTLGVTHVKARLKPGTVIEPSGRATTRADYLDRLLQNRINSGLRRPTAEYIGEVQQTSGKPKPPGVQEKHETEFAGVDQKRSALDAPSTMSTQQQAIQLSEAVRYQIKIAQDPTQTDQMRETAAALAVKKNAELEQLVGKEEAARLLNGAATFEPGTNATPGVMDWAAYFAPGRFVPFNAGTDKHPIIFPRKFDDLPPDMQASMRATAEDINKQTGNLDPLGMNALLEDVAAGRVGGPDWLKANAERLQHQQEEKHAEQEQRNARQAARDAIQQQFKQQQEEARQKRQATLDEERRQQYAQREAERQEDRLASQQRGQQSAADRQRREYEQAQSKRNALQRAMEAGEARRRQLAVSTAQRTATVLAQTQVRLENLPRPGGIGLLLIAILFILFAIMPINPTGLTRMQLLFLAFLGEVELPIDVNGPNGTDNGSVGDWIPPFEAGIGAGIRNSFGTFGNEANNLPSGGISNDLSFSTELPYALRSGPV